MPSRRPNFCAARSRSRPRSSATVLSCPFKSRPSCRADVIRVRAGDIIPADALLLEATSFTVSEAALTGEPYPVDKLAREHT